MTPKNDVGVGEGNRARHNGGSFPIWEKLDYLTDWVGEGGGNVVSGKDCKTIATHELMDWGNDEWEKVFFELSDVSRELRFEFKETIGDLGWEKFSVLEHCIWGNAHGKLYGEEHDGISSGLFVKWVNVYWGAAIRVTCEMEPELMNREVWELGDKFDEV